MFSTMEYESPEIPIKASNKDNMKGQVATYKKLIDKELNEKINNYIKENKLSKTSLFFSVYIYVLSKYSNQTSIYTSVVSKNRNRLQCEEMVGMFVTTQPLLIKVPSNDSFNKFIDNNMKTLLKIYDDEFESLAGLTEKLKLKTLNNCFVYQPENIYSFNNDKNIFKINEDNTLYSIYEDNITTSTLSKFDISFNVVEKQSNYLISFEFNSSIYDIGTIKRFVQSFEEVIHNIDSFGNQITNIEYIPMDEKNKILSNFNSNKFEYEKIKCYHTEFERLAQENPEKIALVFNEKEISYRELDEMSNSLAHYLRMKGVNRNGIIPILCERSYLYVVGTIAIMKSGGAFLPIDPEFPIERIVYMINESSSKLVLTYTEDNELINKLKENKFQLYSLSEHNFTKNIQKIENINESSDLSYVMFTSGTTGKPKGTMITHDNLINHCLYAQTTNGNTDLYGNDIDCIISMSKFIFDMSISDIHYPLLNNIKVILCNKHEYNDPLEISKLIEKYNVKFMYSVPSRFKNYLTLDEFKKSLKHIKYIIFGGEKIDIDTIKILQKITNLKIYNGYGPTETVAVCSINCTDLNKIDLYSDKEIIKSIGKVLCNYEVYILDKYMKPVPIGVEGEIYIGGAGVGKGYLNNIELTNSKFVESPFKSLSNCSNKIYSTGDLGKWTEDGQIIYIGRSDFQVKINGQRIELSEIENTITLYPSIDYAIVVNKKHSKINSDYLICYYKSKINESVSECDLKRFILKKLPKFMCPSYFMKIEKIPLSSSGKINTKELPVINTTKMNIIKYVPAETETEKEICSILQSLFKMKENEVGRTTDFIEFGINSLNSIKFSYMIEKRMKIKLNIKDILSHSSVQEISNYIDEIMKNNVNNSKNEIIKKYEKEQFPLTSQQLGIYIDFIKNKDTTTYNIPISIVLNDNINIERLKYSIQKMFKRNKILRSKYFMNDTEINDNGISDGKTYNNIYGIIDENAQLKIEHFSSDKIKSFVRPFNLEIAPLIRVGIVDNSLLLLDIHHIIADGTTLSVLIQQINENYYDIEKEMTNDEVQYSDYAWFIHEKKETKEYDEQFKFYKEMFSTMEYESPEIPMKSFKKNENADTMNSV
eukprot:jgi/Orpsp1_1/1183858/evm.model.c7180000086973.1